MLQKISLKSIAATTMLVGLCLILGSTPVFAEDNTAETTQEQEKKAETERKEKLKADIKAEKERLQKERQEAQKAKLQETKRKICDQRAGKVSQIVAKAAAQAEKHVDFFDKASARVEEFYKNKELTVANYDTLLADVRAKRAAAVAKIAATKATTLDCASNSGRGNGDLLKGTLRSLHQSLKDYRLSIKKLIAAVKTAALAQRNANGGTE